MNEITGNIEAVLNDLIVGIISLLFSLSSGDFGPVEETTAEALARGLGSLTAEITATARNGGYS